MIYLPRVGSDLTVTLPGELLRAKVTKVVDKNLVFVEIGQPMTRGHSFRLGDLVACRRTPGVLGETWQAIENRPNAPPERKPDAELAEKPAPKVKDRVGKVPGKLKGKADAVDSKKLRGKAQPQSDPRTVGARGAHR